MDPLTEKFWKDLEALGEDGVRINCSKRVYDPTHQALAQEWLRRQESSRINASNLEQRRTARSAKNAAWIAAIAAIIAAICAVIALSRTL